VQLVVVADLEHQILLQGQLLFMQVAEAVMELQVVLVDRVLQEFLAVMVVLQLQVQQVLLILVVVVVEVLVVVRLVLQVALA
jgi:hypothetical protein